MEGTSTSHENTAMPEITASGIPHSNLISPCGTVAGEIPRRKARKISRKTQTTSETNEQRHKTVWGRKLGKGYRHYKGNLTNDAKERKPNGQYPSPYVLQAARTLTAEGYLVGKIFDTGSEFDLIGRSPVTGSILVRVVRPIEIVKNASGVRELYEPDIKKIQPYYRSENDNIQFWVFSREAGLLRYRVFDWGIGNVDTIRKIMRPNSVACPKQETATINVPNQRSRDSPCPASVTG